MRFDELVRTSADVAATSSRKAKIAALADGLRRLAADEVVPGVAYLTGELRQRQIGVGWASLRALTTPAGSPAAAPLTVAGVDAALAVVGAATGSGSQRARRDLLAALFARADDIEREFLRRLLVGELRQGAQAGVMVDAIAAAAGVAVADVRRALLLGGDLRDVAAAALTGSSPAAASAALAAFRLQVGRPLAPMLAQAADSVPAAFDKVTRPTARDATADGADEVAVEAKIDGARVQVHRAGEEIAVFTRSLDDITARVPEVVELVRGLPERVYVLDGEVIALRADGRPQPFQVTAGRVGSRADVGTARVGTPLTAVFFDILHAGGADMLDRPAGERQVALEAIVPAASRVARIVVDSAAPAEEFLAATMRAGHEGVVMKSLDAPYAAGRRGAGWVKVKPRHTFDLIVLAAEWGHGRRQGYLSNLHLGARGPAGGFVMLGKTFKGLTDEMLAWQTERLLELSTDPAVARESWVVDVRPELVVEIAFDGVQTSSRYPGGVALRFARVKGYREDKRPEQIDTIDAVRALLPGS